MVRKRSGLKEPFEREKLAAGIERAVAGEPSLPTPRSRPSWPTIEEEARAAGPEVRSECLGAGRARAPAHARPRLVPPLRLGLQGLRGRRRLRAGGRRAPEDHRAQAPLTDARRIRPRRMFRDKALTAWNFSVVIHPASRVGGGQTTRCCGLVARGPSSAQAPGALGRRDENATREAHHGNGAGADRDRDPSVLHPAGRRTRTTPSSGSAATPASRTSRTAPTPSTSPTSSSRHVVAERHQHRRPEVLPRHARHRRARDVAAAR